MCSFANLLRADALFPHAFLFLQPVHAEGERLIVNVAQLPEEYDSNACALFIARRSCKSSH